MDTTLAPMLFARRFPYADSRLRDGLLIVAGSLLVAALAQISIPLPFTPVPITGQTFAVLLVGAVLGARRGAASLLLYLVEGSLGLPVFAGGVGGLVHFLGPTGGYLLGFVAAAYLVGRLAEVGMDHRFRTAVLIFLAGEAAIYLCGVAWLGFYLGLPKALAAGLLPFLIGDAVKLVTAALALPTAWKLVR
jgi:biotin transport system substrate-specific component